MQIAKKLSSKTSPFTTIPTANRQSQLAQLCYNLPGRQANNNLTITPGYPAKQGVSGQKGAINYYNKNTF